MKEQTVEGHPTSVLYKLLVGPKSGKRDAIDEASVVTSFFWMDFAPGGTNFPHHHEAAEEIYSSLTVKVRWSLAAEWTESRDVIRPRRETLTTSAQTAR